MDDSGVLQDDLRDLLRALGLPDGARPQSPHEVFRECIEEVKRLKAENERLANCHRIVAKQAGFYKPELPDFTIVEIHLGVLRAALRCAGIAPWEMGEHFWVTPSSSEYGR